MSEGLAADTTPEQGLPLHVMLGRIDPTNDQGKQFNLDAVVNPVTEVDLHTMRDLPFEVGLDSVGRDLTLTVGDVNGVDARHVPRYSLFMLHNHPVDSVNHFIGNDDLRIMMGFGANSIHMLITASGIATLRPPQVPPTPNSTAAADRFNAINRWGMANGVDILVGSPQSIVHLEPEERTRVMRQMCQDFGMIVDETTWDDAAGVQRALDRINSVGQPSDASGADEAAAAAHRVLNMPDQPAG